MANDDPLTKLLLDSAILHTRANLQLIDLTEQRADVLLARIPKAVSSRGAATVTDDAPAPPLGHSAATRRPRRTASR